ncbi:MAG: 23S rRNA (pseudouridine(1915)-N(3))-methyltransferase RlmH [Candidatus Cloacimonetes bacterium]|nr:23S rRNA (pseudouridine(1915)-N(3))-methyltransferase RlmH [Candidatus Cloacimonadota bacterium]
MPIKILCVGKTKTDFIQAGISEYEKRISRFSKLKWEFLPDIKLKKNSTTDDVKAKEAEVILKRVSEKDFLISLDENGKQFNSIAFSQKMDSILAHKNIIFIIGGVYGLHYTVLKRADIILGFSKFTFTHQMIRLILLEQIYRAFTIIKNKKYHY